MKIFLRLILIIFVGIFLIGIVAAEISGQPIPKPGSILVFGCILIGLAKFGRKQAAKKRESLWVGWTRGVLESYHDLFGRFSVLYQTVNRSRGIQSFLYRGCSKRFVKYRLILNCRALKPFPLVTQSTQLSFWLHIAVLWRINRSNHWNNPTDSTSLSGKN